MENSTLMTNLAWELPQGMKDQHLEALHVEGAVQSSVELEKQPAANHTTVLSLHTLRKDSEKREVGSISTIQKSYCSTPISHCLLDKKFSIGNSNWKWEMDILYDQRKKEWLDPGQPSTSISKCNIQGTRFFFVSDQKGLEKLYYELFKPGETFNAERYSQLYRLNEEIRRKRSWTGKGNKKVLFFPCTTLGGCFRD